MKDRQDHMRALAEALNLSFTYHFARDPYHNATDRQTLEDVANFVLWERHQVEYKDPPITDTLTRLFPFKWSVLLPLECNVLNQLSRQVWRCPTWINCPSPTWRYTRCRFMAPARLWPSQGWFELLMRVSCWSSPAHDSIFFPSIYSIIRREWSSGPNKGREASICCVAR